MVGRDPRQGVIIPRYEPPEGHAPAGPDRRLDQRRWALTVVEATLRLPEGTIRRRRASTACGSPWEAGRDARAARVGRARSRVLLPHHLLLELAHAGLVERRHRAHAARHRPFRDHALVRVAWPDGATRSPMPPMGEMIVIAV
jgi:hypothetical protein